MDYKISKLYILKLINLKNCYCAWFFALKFQSSKLNVADYFYKNNGDVAQFGVSPTWSNINFFTLAAVRTNEEIVAAKNDITVKCVTTDEGYAGEMFLPFTVFAGLEQTISDGEEIAIAFVFADNDRDDLGRKRVQVSNVPHFVEAWKTKTAKMPLFKFVD